MAAKQLPKQMPASVQVVAGLGTLLALVWQSALVFEKAGDSILGLGRVLLGAIVYSLLVYYIFQGWGKFRNCLLANWVRVLVIMEFVYGVVVIANAFFADIAMMANSWVYLLGLALLAIHLTILVLNGQGREASGV